MNADLSLIQICVHSRLSAANLCRWSWWCIGKGDPVDRLPIVSRHHLDRIPRTPIEKRAVRTFAGTLLTTDAEIWIDFDSAKRRMVLIRHPEHTRFNRTILDTGGRAGATSTTIGGDCKYPGALFASRLTVALRHRPMLFYNV